MSQFNGSQFLADAARVLSSTSDVDLAAMADKALTDSQTFADCEHVECHRAANALRRVALLALPLIMDECLKRRAARKAQADSGAPSSSPSAGDIPPSILRRLRPSDN